MGKSPTFPKCLRVQRQFKSYHEMWRAEDKVQRQLLNLFSCIKLSGT